MHSQFEPEPIHENDRAALERYLNQFCAPLERDLSAEECDATREELRAHLLLSAAAHQELGATPEEALAAAVKGFGDAHLLGRALAQEKSVPVRAKRRLARWTCLLGGLTGGYVGLNLIHLLPFLVGIDPAQGNASPFTLWQLLLFLLGGRGGWLLANGKRALACGPLAGLAGALTGMAASIACTLFASGRGWLGATYQIDRASLLLEAGLGAAVGWRLWKRPQSLPGSILLGSAAFGLPEALIALQRLYIYPDYRNAHILSIMATATMLWCASGGITGAAMGLLARIKTSRAARRWFPSDPKSENADIDLLVN